MTEEQAKIRDWLLMLIAGAVDVLIVPTVPDTNDELSELLMRMAETATEKLKGDSFTPGTIIVSLATYLIAVAVMMADRDRKGEL